MGGVHFIWDLEDEPDGNIQHLAEHGVTREEFEEVYFDRGESSLEGASRTSGRPMKSGWTSTGKYLLIIWDEVLDDPRTIYPVTAYPVDPPWRRARRKKR